MRKGRVIFVFWLVFALAIAMSTASYAWLAMNTAASFRGFEIACESDSLYLEISGDPASEFGKVVSFDAVSYMSLDSSVHEVLLVSYGEVESIGALRIYPNEINTGNGEYFGAPNGKFDKSSNRRYYVRADSSIGKGKHNYIDVTDRLKDGQDIRGYYVIDDSAVTYPTALTSTDFYYVKTSNGKGGFDYSCIGTFKVGEKLAGRKYWGYAYSSEFDESQSHNAINVVSMDTPTKDYCLKRTVYIRGAAGTGDARDLGVVSVEVDGVRNYLTDAIRILFIAKSDTGKTVTKIYNHRDRETFNGLLFDEILGNENELVTVEMFIYFDGKDEDAHDNDGFLTSHKVSVSFGISDHIYN